MVERIIQKILKDKIDIDKLLVVTFTNAAASEMRERVLDAIYKKLDEMPEDENLQKQIILLGKSNISTIHSFCLDVIRNNFFEIDLPANFRIASEEEIELLRQEVLEDVFDELYEAEDKDFTRLIESYTGYRGDEPVKEIVFHIERMIQSMPFPKKWLEEKVAMFCPQNHEKQDFSQSVWGKILINDLKEEILDAITHFKIQKNKLDQYQELEKYSTTLQNDIDTLQGLYDCLYSWEDAFAYASNLEFKRWPSDKNVTLELKEEVKTVRDKIKEKIVGKIRKTLLYPSEEAFQDIYLLYDNLVALKNLVLKFEESFKAKKKMKNIIDFTDIEHYALEILVREDEKGKYVPTEVAKNYQEKFEEIAIDEYQDSNQVQELILKSVSRGNNIFMVGDVKQSIYKFRQACPELFLDKYEHYDLAGNEKGFKIQLFKNFRSHQNILDITNTIFENIMSKELGDIDYTNEEYLNLGADYADVQNGVGKSELHLIDIADEKGENTWEEAEETEEDEAEEENEKDLSNVELEAIFVAQRIEELIKSGKMIKGKDGKYRKIEYRDIVILLRSTRSTAPIFEKELTKNKIPVFSDTTTEYLNTMEVQTIINTLKILDNPLDDIHLVSVMRSPIGAFSDNEILEIRLEDREASVYSNLRNMQKKGDFLAQDKLETFLKHIQEWKQESEYLSLAELIWKIYIDTGFLEYVGLMPNGFLRQANLKMLFERAKEYEKTSFSGLFNFIRFTEKLKAGNSDMSAAKVIGETENVVRIMSIHKSKGLEFPVVFLCCANKKINLQDLKTNILLHKDIGFGPQYIDYERKIEYPTAAKQAIKIVGKNESISEEMRILYVALTRAKEKLIITGTVRDFQKQEQNKKELWEAYASQESHKINPILLKKYISYLDWIQFVMFSKAKQNDLKIQVHTKEELKNTEIKEEERRALDFEQNIDFEEYEKIFAWQYPDKALIHLPEKTTVSQIKELKNEENTLENKIGLEEIMTHFAEHNHTLTASKRGTLMHFVLQKLDFRKSYTMQDLQQFIDDLLLQKRMLEEEAQAIDLQKINDFVHSEIYTRIRKAKQIEKEKAFCIRTNLEEYGGQEMAIQGMIDLYFIDETDKLVLADYKTDFVKDEKSLKDKYWVQLNIYKKALEISLNKKVDEMYIYSTHLNQWINL